MFDIRIIVLFNNKNDNILWRWPTLTINSIVTYLNVYLNIRRHFHFFDGMGVTEVKITSKQHFHGRMNVKYLIIIIEILIEYS